MLPFPQIHGVKLKIFAKNELVLIARAKNSADKRLASFGKDLCCCFHRENSLPHLVARILTNLLQKSSRNRLVSQK
ncbi:hypothetical protein [Vibrio navarrensis]|uniref:hypothetical protein n=1 Tax=Vibrio navarrensis TaxID=29495 RepID=UPI0018683543|nr:hypothetical protein [Vibrio navarrensis]